MALTFFPPSAAFVHPHISLNVIVVTLATPHPPPSGRSLELRKLDRLATWLAYTAVQSVLDDQGAKRPVLLPAEDDPFLLAEAVKEVLDNGALRQSLVAKGRERLKQFEPDVARAAFAEQLLAVV